MSSYSFLHLRSLKNLVFSLFFLISINFLFGSKNVQEFDQPSVDEKRVEKFLKHLMIEEVGLYTLLGSKPMTLFSLVPIIDEVEKREIYKTKSELYRKHISLEKFQLEQGDPQKLWNDWKSVESKYLGKQYLIIGDKELKEGIFINIPSVIFVLDKWKKDFVKATGEYFDPMEAVFFIGDKSSSFWNKVRKNHYLLGLLLGYGEENARYFQWENEKKLESPLRRGTNIYPGYTGKAAHELTVEDLDVPTFIIYQVIDQQLEKYKVEQKRCLELYKNEDFFELTVKFLRGIPPKRQKRILSDEAWKLIKKQSGYNSKFLP